MRLFFKKDKDTCNRESCVKAHEMFWKVASLTLHIHHKCAKELVGLFKMFYFMQDKKHSNSVLS